MAINGLEYIASYPDLIAAFGANEAAGRQHYETSGVQEGRSVTFNGLEYIASYDDLIQAFGADEDAGAAHYIASGAAEGRVRDDFSAEQYLAKYGGLQAAFGGDLEAATRHYITNGFAEGRSDDGGAAADPLWNGGLEILALGDSITRGSGSVDAGGYRGPLDTLFNNAGLPVDFVGTMQSGQIPDADHEGVSGRPATTLAGQVTDIVEATSPEAVLLLIGTNDVLEEADAASTVPGEVVGIVNQIHAVDPATHVLVANLPVIVRGADVSVVRDATNAGLAQAVNQLAAQGSEVSLVDTSSILASDLTDGIHPNASGYAKLAQAWFAAIQDAIPPPSGGAALALASTAGEEASGASLFDHDTASGIAAALAAHDFIV